MWLEAIGATQDVGLALAEEGLELGGLGLRLRGRVCEIIQEGTHALLFGVWPEHRAEAVVVEFEGQVDFLAHRRFVSPASKTPLGRSRQRKAGATISCENRTRADSRVACRGTLRTVTVDHDFQLLQGRVHQSGSVSMTPRELVQMVGAKRRGALIVDQIRSRLARHKLETDPDFMDVGADDPVDVVSVGGDEVEPPYLEPLTDALEQVSKDPEDPTTTTVRTMLSWFGAQRRGPAISDTIRATLVGFDLETEPDFESVHVDEKVRLVRIHPPADDSEVPDGGGVEADEPRPSSATAQGSEITTFHVGTLDEANRPVVCIKPQSSIREAMSRMLAERVSYLPIMANERRVNGLVRWKDLGGYLLLQASANLDDPIENAATKPIEVNFNEPFLSVIERIIHNGCVLVRGPENRVTGIITKKDLAKRMLELTRPFVTLGEIERGIRGLVERGEFSASELKELALDPAVPRDVKTVNDLSLGEYQRLLENPEGWARLKLGIEKRPLVDALHEVRRVRNGVMHFEQSGPTEAERHRLSTFLDMVYQIRRFTDAEPKPA